MRPQLARTWCWCSLPAEGPRSSSAGRADGLYPVASGVCPRPRSPRGCRRWSRGVGLGGAQGRGPFLRWWLRHHPVDAAQRRHHLSLDDRRPVPQCRCPGPSHPRSSRAHGGRGRLRRWGSGWRSVGRALVAFAPSFVFVLVGGRHFDQIRANGAVESFLTGAGPAVIGAIAGSAIPLSLALGHLWQIPVLAGALGWLFVARRSAVTALLIAGAIGVVVALAGVPA